MKDRERERERENDLRLPKLQLKTELTGQKHSGPDVYRRAVTQGGAVEEFASAGRHITVVITFCMHSVWQTTVYSYLKSS